MLIPEGDRDNPEKFNEKYFVNQYASDALVEDESCRVIYNITAASQTNNPRVVNQIFHFDIYVKKKYTYGASELNYFLSRQKLIACRLNYLCTKEIRKQFRHTLFCTGEADMYSRVVGYRRYTIGFAYKQPY